MRQSKVVILLLLLFATLVCPETVYAQKRIGTVHALSAANTVHQYPGIVHFEDGRTEEYALVEMPNNTHGNTRETIRVKRSKEDTDFESLSAKDIEAISFWVESVPEKVLKLYAISRTYCLNPDAIKPKTVTTKDWCMPLGHQSAWGQTFIRFDVYEINKKTGEVSCYLLNSYNYALVCIYLHNKTALWDCLSAAPFNDIWWMHKTQSKQQKKKGINPNAEIYEPFRSNEVVYENLLEGKYNGDDIQYVLDEMAKTLVHKSTKQ